MSQLAQPAPQNISVGEGAFGDVRLIVMQFESVNGTWVCFLPKDEAAKFARQLLQASTGITLAPADTPLPPLS